MKPITVVISQGQSHNPAKRKLEEAVAAELGQQSGLSLMIVPHLYDLTPNGSVITTLKGVEGNIVVLSWMYSRAAHWLLDRQDVRGQIGEIELTYGDEDDDNESQGTDDDKLRVVDEREQPERWIFCLDFRASEKPEDFIEELQRITRESQSAELLQWIKGDPSEDALNRYLQPTNGSGHAAGNGHSSNGNGSPAKQIEEPAGRRWYPVIDFSRCTNCMECIDFCLFGVYGVDQQETILVEQPDNCRKGCPACSRVCPENAIIFPQHKSPAIAGAQTAAEGLKIDLSKLFGAPDSDKDALAVAARERDEQLLLAGREAVGMNVGMPKRQDDRPERPKDDLDELLDELDELD